MVARRRPWLTVLRVGVVVLLAVWAGSLIEGVRHPVWAPLGNYPVQRVGNRDGSGDVPSVYIDGILRVHGIKCNDSKSPVPVRGTQEWVSVQPPGSIIPTSRGTAIRPPGCSSKDYDNPIPVEVQTRTKAMWANGAVNVSWYISGSDTPYDETGKRVGVEVPWQTENFLILPNPYAVTTTNP
jgi:hypothetical protein